MARASFLMVVVPLALEVRSPSPRPRKESEEAGSVAALELELELPEAGPGAEWAPARRPAPLAADRTRMDVPGGSGPARGG